MFSLIANECFSITSVIARIMIETCCEHDRNYLNFDRSKTKHVSAIVVSSLNTKPCNSKFELHFSVFFFVRKTA